MLSSVLVANRGEIAVRVIKTAKRLGLRTVAVFSEADRDAPHVAAADEAVFIGPAPASDSYLDVSRVLAAAKRSGAEAIHPGYGFLSENAAFAEACAEAGVVFIGPPPAAIRAMGLKDGAKALMEKAGVPVVPGYHGERQEPEFLKQKAYEIGYPILIKAVAGGGGKGMRRVDKVIEFDDALAAARREASAAFGDDRVLLEKYVLNPRHVEIQVFADAHGRAVSLYERDCSIQRRHQKVMEEAPAPGMSPELRAAMGKAAVAAAEAVGYVGAGTVEFIADGSDGLQADRFWFMEMNTRLQVEHPVTEAVTGLDLVEWQLRVASGEHLPADADAAPIDGHAIEVRLYAEDPDQNFLPSIGRLDRLRLPEGEGIRVDSGVGEGDTVTAFYDPMIAKIIAHGADRDQALDRMATALAVTEVAGPKTNLPFLRALVDAPTVRAAAHDTGFVDANAAAFAEGGVSDGAIAAAAAMLFAPPEPVVRSDGWRDPWSAADGFALSGSMERGARVTVDGVPQDVRVRWTENGPTIAGDEVPDDVTVAVTEGGIYALQGGRSVRVERLDPLEMDLSDLSGDDRIVAPMHGKLTAVYVAEGDAVAKGDRLFTVEAMKMEHTVVAPEEGRVASLAAAPGDQVAQGAPIVVLEAAVAEA
ncbi:3-methylcrotonyl-CoA carboxylase alpha subunit [Amorphus orientalis]|uniref:3-methylcrotonyl-CoA carboxylase alpha subunit n=1 Tax=Amorphus orientalis TaxID=649198 RepID=A0AAE3VRP8_9HYPH|nr:acetyl-CoA carboxylase biotin carboxylase subunit [Amorphus orientalis]MDQ0317134.1 3-methylcrotonyl-CoA carboxylase alpha subunit [Amorphus orientalis]